MQTKTLKIHPDDNLEVALVDLKKSETIIINGESYLLQTNVPAKHKFATVDLYPNDGLTMYGVLVGKALKPIKKGELISTNNVTHAANDYKLGARKINFNLPDISKWKNKTFEGYHRADGSVGIANYWLVIPLVFCENKNVDVIQEAFIKELGYQQPTSVYQQQVNKLVKLYQSGESIDDLLDTDIEANDDVEINAAKIFPNIDGIKFLTHTLGCGGTRQDAQNLCGLLAGYIVHPNVAGATVLSLGCQNAQIGLLNEEIKKRTADFSKPLYILDHQQIGSEAKLLQQAIKKTFVGLAGANQLQRKPAPLSKLCIGLECGGSDGFSGISANPAVGYLSDLIVTLGGSVILSEFPELCGVEQEISDRCINETIATKFMQIMTSYNARAKSVGSGFEANPSPGNIKDGLITDAIKSAGAAKKGGVSPVTDVLDYPEKVTKPGLNLLCTPGSDIESTTAEVGAGATIVLFTTGLGTPTGNPVAPVVKISSNTNLFTKMNDIIDIDAGTIINGTETIEQVATRMLEYIIKLASGGIKTKAQAAAHDDFIPWKRDISL
ncbi:MAG: altronate dehydratase family protein [Ginsengibacter sp.]